MTKFNLDIPKQGHIIAFKYEKFNLFGEAIYRQQLKVGFKKDEARYTHVEISSGGPYSMRIMPPQARLIKDLHIRYKGCYVKFLRYRDKDFDKNVRYKISSIHNGLAANLRYDWLGVLAFIIPGMGNFKGRPFCSEAVVEAYQIFYPYLFGALPPSGVYPANFVADKEFEVYWKGQIE